MACREKNTFSSQHRHHTCITFTNSPFPRLNRNLNPAAIKPHTQHNVFQLKPCLCKQANILCFIMLYIICRGCTLVYRYTPPIYVAGETTCLHTELDLPPGCLSCWSQGRSSGWRAALASLARRLFVEPLRFGLPLLPAEPPCSIGDWGTTSAMELDSGKE